MPSGPFVSPWDQVFARPPLRRESRDFTLPDGRTLRLTFRELDEVGKLAIAGRLQEYTAKYLEGENGKPPRPLIVGKTRVTVSAKLLQVIATLQALEAPEEGEQWPAGQQPFGLLEWCGAALRWEKTWQAVLAWSNDFIPREDEPGNSEGDEDPKSSSTTS